MMRASAAFGALMMLAALAACGGDSTSPAQPDLAKRAYVVSRDSGELTVIDLDSFDVIAKVKTGPVGSHMAEISQDLRKIYISQSDANEVVVVDATTYQVTRRIPVGAHPTHMIMARDGKLLAVMDEWEGAVSFIDPATDSERARLPGFVTPHYLRFAPDGRYAYVANAGASRITRVDLQTLAIDGQLTLAGVDGDAPIADEGGFHDAQIDADGVLYAAHAASGRVLVYDTTTQTQLPELQVGARPWMVYAEHPFTNLPRHYLVPNLGDKTVSRINGQIGMVETGSLPGDEESYGVNYTSLAPGKAFVMNRVRQDIAVVDTDNGTVTARIQVGGNTETAATTADGKWIIAAVSGANRVVVINALSNEIVKSLDGLAEYPWSVTVPHGQNYCH